MFKLWTCNRAAMSYCGIPVAEPEVGKSYVLGLVQEVKKEHRNRSVMTKILSTLLAVFLCAVTAFGQDDPHGITDTIRIADVTAAPGDKIEVEVYIFSDIELLSLTVPVKFAEQVLTLDSIWYDGSKLEYLSSHPYGIDNEAGTGLIGGIVLTEEPIPAGTGLLATLDFTVAQTAEIGQTYLFDTIFVPPAGYVLLVTVDHDKVYPAFAPGHLTIVDHNEAPIFREISEQVVFEGDSVSFTVSAIDPDGGTVSYSAMKFPNGASFDVATGQFTWIPPYTGPNSAVGSPCTVKFVASDGDITSHYAVDITVLNRNRAPVVNIPDTVGCDVGDSIFLVISAADPDLETVEVEVTSLPSGADYQRGNPGYVSWRTSLSDSGSYELLVTATDAVGAEASETLTLLVHAAAACELDISDIQAISGNTGIVEVNLHNRVLIDHMNLLIRYDPTALTLLSTSAIGTRVDYWGQFIETINQADGRVWLDAGANLPGHDGNDPLEIGDGPVMKLNFLVTSNLDFAGQLVRVEFEFIDTLSLLDNTLITPEGEVLGQGDVSYENGAIFIKQHDALIGDINLNSVPFEVGDVVYFTNYFIDPGSYPLDGDRWGNSDINQDGRPGTIGDLISLINIIGGSGTSKILAGEHAGSTANVDARVVSTGTDITVQSAAPVGGAYFVISAEGESSIEAVAGGDHRKVDIHQSFDGELLRVLVLSKDASGIAAGGEPVLRLLHDGGLRVSIRETMLADQQGFSLTAELGKATQLPASFTLDQNYPNPFNPSTNIGFSLPREGRVNLKIYNIEGKLVTTLVDGLMPSGRHTVVWDGRDNTGRAAASGIYFYRLNTEGFSDTRKMTLIK